jgi:hypothetical protein
MGLIDGVYDKVPDNTDYPYITLGDVRARDWSSVTTDGMSLSITINVYSRGAGRKEIHAIMAQLMVLLHDQDLTITGHALIMMRYDASNIELNRDGETYEGEMRFNALTQVLV